MSNQLAVLFPGIGYHIDKPLLYYSAKLARARGCDLLAVQYPALPTGLRGHAEKIEQAVQTALSAAEEQLTAIDWTAYDRVFFLSKSIGTAIAARYAVQHNIHPRQVYYLSLIHISVRSLRSPSRSTCRARFCSTTAAHA